MICDYCRGAAELVTGATIYPDRPDLHAKQFWRCVPCHAYVGCHGLTDRPLGRLANARLRAAKICAHAAFDPFWRDQHWSRSHAYHWLSSALGIKAADCHIGMFTVEQCEAVVAAVERALLP
jgi:hypothetical protein